MLDEGGKWRLAPAYDMTFIFNTSGTGPNKDHRLSVCGKTSEITKDDLIDFARRNEIRNAKAAIDAIADSLKNFDKYAEANKITQPWRSIINKTITDTLADYGYIDHNQKTEDALIDSFGRFLHSNKFKKTL